MPMIARNLLLDERSDVGIVANMFAEHDYVTLEMAEAELSKTLRPNCKYTAKERAANSFAKLYFEFGTLFFCFVVDGQIREGLSILKRPQGFERVISSDRPLDMPLAWERKPMAKAGK